SPSDVPPIAEAKPVEPALEVKADTIWALVAQAPQEPAQPGQGRSEPGKSKFEVQRAFLRGNVSVHQDPAPGKARGLDLSARDADVYRQGEGLYLIEANGSPGRPAVAISEDRMIVGSILHVDQTIDRAWVRGPGYLVQEATADDDPKAKDPKDPEAAKGHPSTKGPMTIAWGQRMEFYGHPDDDPEGPARAEFYGLIRARSPELAAACEEKMIAYFDGPISFVRPKRDPNAPPRESKPRPDIAKVHCLKNVDLIYRRFDPETGLLQQKDRVLGPDVTYERRSGEFDVEGAGVVYHYTRKKPSDTADEKVASSSASGRIKPVSDPRSKDAKAKAKAKTKGKAADPPEVPPLELTRIEFQRRMKGHFDAGPVRGDKDKDKELTPRGPREANFFGSPQLLRAEVESEDADLDADRPLPEYVLLTAKTLQLRSEPPPLGSKGPDRNLLKAWGDPQARTQDGALRGDLINYDSETGNFFAYGYENEVTLARQDTVGQPPSYGRGRVLIYNPKTGDSRLIDPSDFVALDSRSIGRTFFVPPPPEPKERKPPRNTPRLPSRSDKERRGFSGR
ncbi:MAG: hypothetical protein IRY99_18160, partial [Isosphaeraceae bacterium]|nr:hypothetical protein [Isosphaeraceae bacterium]